jgi:hypothetical protein
MNLPAVDLSLPHTNPSAALTIDKGTAKKLCVILSPQGGREYKIKHGRGVKNLSGCDQTGRC